MRLLILLEVFRIAAVWLAGYQIHSGRCHGGYEELMALEEVRLRTAGLQCDEYGDPLDAHESKTSGADADTNGRTSASSLGDHGLHERTIGNLLEEARRKDRDEIRRTAASTEQAREKYHVRRSHGTLLTYLLIYDAILLAVVLLNAVRHNIMYQTWGEPLMWINLTYAKFLYGLGSFPFLIFHVPVLGNALHASKPTGFDKHGRLVPTLTNLELKKRDKFLSERDGRPTKPPSDRFRAHLGSLSTGAGDRAAGDGARQRGGEQSGSLRHPGVHR